MKIIDFRTSGYFPGSIIFLGILLMGASIFIFLKSWIAGVILLLTSVTILTAHNRLRIDLDGKVFLDYLWVLGFKRGSSCSFESLQYIFIKKVIVSQKLNARVSTTTIRKEVYKGYLKFSEENKIFLAENEQKENLIVKLRIISEKLHVDVVDYSKEDR